MLLFGHTGITAGIVKVCDILGSINRPLGSYESDSSSRFSLTIGKKRLHLYHRLNGIRRQIGLI